MTDTTKPDATATKQSSGPKPASKRRMAREPKAGASASEGEAEPKPNESGAANAKRPTPEPAPRAESKIASVIALLQRPEGATLEQMVTATGWLPHTTRAALTGLKKKGHVITKDKADGVTRYTIAAAAQS